MFLGLILRFYFALHNPQAAPAKNNNEVKVGALILSEVWKYWSQVCSELKQVEDSMWKMQTMQDQDTG